jgi:hypothetical protein
VHTVHPSGITCSADGFMLAVGASPGQGTLQIAPELVIGTRFARTR